MSCHHRLSIVYITYLENCPDANVRNFPGEKLEFGKPRTTRQQLRRDRLSRRRFGLAAPAVSIGSIRVLMRNVLKKPRGSSL